tara:strand:- start:185 stop:784 length:600 start_codon:yes stop_codon:yes gene_type:complete
MQVLYVGQDDAEPSEYCAGSTVCMALVEKISKPIRVQNCNILRRHQELPDWLTGTPILIDEEDQEPLRGTQAVRYLQAMLRNEEKALYVERTRAPPGKPGQTARVATHAPPRLEAAQTRQPTARMNDTIPNEATSPEQNVESAMLDDEAPDTAQDATANGAEVENVPLGTGKVDDTELQRFMEARKNSLASVAPSPSQQ